MNAVVTFFPVVVKPPFEVTETGWGEFEVIVKIYFVDPTERPVRLKCCSCLRSLCISYTVQCNILLKNTSAVAPHVALQIMLIIVLFILEANCLVSVIDNVTVACV